ncbi:hypothetical protein GCM10029978_046950 [Actinoallomurus acanthiterrae]
MGRSTTSHTDRSARRAPGYERDGLATVLLAMQRLVLGELPLRPEDRFLDVGCATGFAVRFAAAIAGRAVGIDNATSMIRQARKHTMPASRIAFLMADAQRLPFPAQTFSAIACVSALHTFTDPLRAVEEMARVLRADGRIVIGDFLPVSDQRKRWWHKVERTDEASHPVRVLTRSGLIVTADRRYLTPFGPYAVTTAIK